MKKFAIRIEEIQEDGRRTQCLPFVELAEGCEFQTNGFCLLGIDRVHSEGNALALNISISEIAEVLASDDDLAKAALIAVKIAKTQRVKEVPRNG